MKLLRFTSENSNGIFTSYLNQELLIGKQSQIALGSVALELNEKELVITGANDEVQFQMATGGLKSFRLNHATYTSANFQVLFDDFTTKANIAMGSLVATPDAANLQIARPSEIGKQCLMKKGKDGKTQIKMNKARSAPYGAQLQTNIKQQTIDAGVKAAVVLGNITNDSTSILANSQFGQATYVCSVSQTHAIAKGCGIHRCKIRQLTNNGGASNGISLSLHKVNPLLSSTPFSVTDIDYGIKFRSVFNGLTQEGYYQYVVDGVLIDPAQADRIPFGANTTTAANTRDIVSLEIIDGSLRGVVYQAQANLSDPPLARELFRVAYDGVTNLWGSYTLHGGGAGMAQAGVMINYIRYTPDPYQAEADPSIATSVFELTPHDSSPLSASTPQAQRQTPSNHDIKFTGTEVSSFLGFLTSRLPQEQGFLVSNYTAIFESDNRFSSIILNDCFMIEMLNLPLESYDFDDDHRKRKNILSILPFDDSKNNCLVIPPQLRFLDLNNANEMRMNEIKFRIVRSDYTILSLNGLSSVVMYLRQKGE